MASKKKKKSMDMSCFWRYVKVFWISIKWIYSRNETLIEYIKRETIARTRRRWAAKLRIANCDTRDEETQVSAAIARQCRQLSLMPPKNKIHPFLLVIKVRIFYLVVILNGFYYRYASRWFGKYLLSGGFKFSSIISMETLARTISRVGWPYFFYSSSTRL